ncbi:MAG: hypothetical protein R3C99_16265 [Pirellulaceae bacterium]
MPFPQFDPTRLIIRPLDERQHDLSIERHLPLDELPTELEPAAMRDLAILGERLVQARQRGASVLLLMGAHVIRAGVARQLIDLMQRGLITHIGMNGAGPIHDYELSRIGATCESVARYIRSGEFGLWRETGEINDIVRRGAAAGMGLGESVGRAILDSDFPYKELSVLAAGVRLNVPVTAHIGIGYDIIHEHPNFDPAAFGTASYRDFLTVCDTVERLEGGVFLCFGSAVMGPEVYLKALSMARNVAHQEGPAHRKFYNSSLRPHSYRRRVESRSSEIESPVLLSPLENHSGPNRGRWRGELLRMRRSSANAAASTSRGVALRGRSLDPVERRETGWIAPTASSDSAAQCDSLDGSFGRPRLAQYTLRV